VTDNVLMLGQAGFGISQAVKLLNSITTHIQLLRANKEVELDHKEVVPGDMLILQLTSSYSLSLFGFPPCL
jgi:ABC-type phosphate transport system ATPase subunit